MGNDGGSIPTRRELVKSAARLPTVSELKATALEAQTHAWETDPISGDPLDLDAVVSNWCGRLFNYETVLEGLLPGAAAAEDDAAGKEEAGEAPVDGMPTLASSGIRSLRDVVRLQCRRASTKRIAPWQCPVTLKEIGPSTKAVYLAPCGHVFAEAALATILTDLLCPECSLAISADNVIPILPADTAALSKLRQRIEALRAEGLSHSLKKNKSQGHGDKKKGKKRKAGSDAKDGQASNGGKDAPVSDEDAALQKKEKRPNGGKNGVDKRVSGINNSLAASLTAKVLAEQDELNKRRKLATTR